MGSSHYGGGGIKFGGMTINLDNINISNYVCDFGNVVVGNSQKKSFRLTNVGKIPVTFAFDKKLLNNAQISIEPDKVQKLNANHSVMFNVTFSTRQKNVYGRKRFPIPIDVKNGPTYTIDFLANMTIPELSMSTELLDFGKVCVNTRKTVKIRLENNKEVDCEWKFMQKSGEAGEITGLEQPGQKQEVVEIPSLASVRNACSRTAYNC
jgi:hydrocephalus-inducing protein